MKAYELRQFGIQNLEAVERPAPEPGDNEVIVKFHAVSLNYRDLMFVRGAYNPKARLPAVPFSDGAGEVAAAGKYAKKWNIGDRVCPIFTQAWTDGGLTIEKRRTTLGGGDLDGTLREYGAFDENGLVEIPGNLSFEEAATLPCAGVTAWNALIVSGGLKAGDTVLMLGTGGVSVFALQIAKMHGARAIITSSSDAKIEKARALGADETINYSKTPDWDKQVLALTNRTGVDHVVEVGGAGTLSKSLNAVRIGGHVVVIGVLAGAGEFDPRSILMKSVRMQGILVGSRKMFEDMNRAISGNRMRPVIDRTFAFEEAAEALRYMERASHFGKIVVRVNS
ncbi:MAG: zinc-dependent alcohol dehydrogenase family protein [Candidatus Acidiferrales bacterium]